MSLHNTNMKRNLNIGMMLSMARIMAEKLVSRYFLVEPNLWSFKTSIDFDVATIIGFLKEHVLIKIFKLI